MGVTPGGRSPVSSRRQAPSFVRLALVPLLLVTGLCLAPAPLAAGAPDTRWVPFAPGSPEASPTVTVSELDTGLTIHVESFGFHVQDLEAEGETYQQIGIPGCGLRAPAPGQPLLPFRGLLLRVPDGVDLELAVDTGPGLPVLGNVTVYPQQPPEPDSGGPAAPFVKDTVVYARDAFTPGELVAPTLDGKVRDERVVFLEVSPLQYNPARRQLMGYPHLTITLSHGVAVAVGPDGPEPDEKPDGIEYLIIYHDPFEAALEPLVEWKRLKGLTVETVPVSAVGTTSADIDSYLQSRYDNDPDLTYVVLVGDQDEVPAEMIDGYPTDLYYGCVSGNDYLPDLYLGRLSVSSEADCANVVDKVVTYQRHPLIEPWHDDYLTASYLQDSNDHDCEADRWFFETSTDIMAFMRDSVGMDIHTAACTSSAATCDPVTWRASGYPHRPAGHSGQDVPQVLRDLLTADSRANQDIHDAINAGAGIVFHRDHGGVSGWGDPPFRSWDVDDLENEWRLPVVFSINCLTGKFTQDSFAEHFMRKYPGGAVGVLAATEVSYSGYNDLLARGLHDCLWDDFDPADGGNVYPHSYRPGVAMNYGKYYMFHWEGAGGLTRYQFELYNWHGDPEMMVFTDTPVAPDVSTSCPLLLGEDTVTVDCSIEGTLVAVTLDGVLLGRATVVGGRAVITLDPMPDTSATLDVVVTGYNVDPWEGTCEVIDCQEPSGLGNNTASDWNGACADEGVLVTWPSDPAEWGDRGAGTRSYDVLRNGSPLQTGLAYGTTSVVDTSGLPGVTYTYSVRYHNGCGQQATTAGVEAADAWLGPGSPALTGIADPDPCAQDGLAIDYEPGPLSPDRHDLYVDGTLAVSDFPSGGRYDPGDSAGHLYTIRAVRGTCSADSAAAGAIDHDDTPADLVYDAGFDPLSTLTELCGDGDDHVEPGETWSVTVRLRNTSSCRTAASARAALASGASSPVSAAVCNNPGDYGDVPPFGSSDFDYVFDLDDSAACVSDVDFDLGGMLWAGGGPASAPSAFQVQVGAQAPGANEWALLPEPMTAEAGQSEGSLEPGPSVAAPDADSASLAYAFGYLPSPGASHRVELQAAEDTFMDQKRPDDNAGGNDELEVKPTDNDQHTRLLLQVDLASIPAGVTVDSATLRLHPTRDGVATHALHRVTRAWSGQGATWNERLAGTAWDEPNGGGDYATTPEDTASVADGTAFVDWDVTALVQAWADGTPNQGLLIRSADEGARGDEVKYASSEHGTAALRPHLTVEYTEPPLGVDWRSSVRVELWNGAAWHTLKEYGEPDGNPIDLLALGAYAGPGAHRLRLSEQDGGRATLDTLAPGLGLHVVETPLDECDRSPTCECLLPTPGEVSDDTPHRLALAKNGTAVDLEYEDLSAINYNVYVSTRKHTDPFLVTDPGQGKRACTVPWTPAGPGMLRTHGFDVEAGVAQSPGLYFILVTADNGSPREGPMGQGSDGQERTPDSWCAR